MKNFLLCDHPFVLNSGKFEGACILLYLLRCSQHPLQCMTWAKSTSCRSYISVNSIFVLYLCSCNMMNNLILASTMSASAAARLCNTKLLVTSNPKIFYSKISSDLEICLPKNIFDMSNVI